MVICVLCLLWLTSDRILVTALTDTSIRETVEIYVTDPRVAEAKWGPIESWDTSQVTNMSYLFARQSTFNGDVSGWNTSSVVNVEFMFFGMFFCLSGTHRHSTASSTQPTFSGFSGHTGAYAFVQTSLVGILPKSRR